MHRIALCIATCGVITLIGSIANAQSAFAFSYSGPGVSASGILETSPLTPAVPGEFLITGLTGTRNGSPMTLLPGNPNGSPVSVGPTLFYDDILYYPPTAPDPYLDFDGGGFSSNGTDYAVYFDSMPISYVEVDYNNNSITLTSGTLDPVPEPGIYALLGSLGLSGAAFLRRKRAR